MADSRSGERGQAIVLAAVLMTVVLGLTALIIDAGFGYVTRRQQQNAADAASLAATRLIAQGVQSGAAINAEVEKYVRLNKGDPTMFEASYLNEDGSVNSRVSASGVVPASASGVKVVSKKNLTGFFSQFLGQGTFQTAARADVVTRQTNQPRAWSGLAPIAVPREGLVSGQDYPIWNPNFPVHWPGYGLPMKYKGLVDLTNFVANPTQARCNDSSLSRRENCWAQYGLEGSVPIGAQVPIDNGDLGANIGTGLRENILAQGLDDNDGKGLYGIIYIIVFDRYDPGNPRGEITVNSFAAFKLHESDLHSSNARAQFVNFVDPSAIPGYSTTTSSGPRITQMVPPRP